MMNKLFFNLLGLLTVCCLISPASAQDQPDSPPAPEATSESNIEKNGPPQDSQSPPQKSDQSKAPEVLGLEKLISDLKDKVANPVPTDPEAHMLEKEIARAYLKLNDFDNAIVHMTNSLNLQNNPSVREYQALGRLLVQTDQFAEAEQVLKKGWEAYPDSLEMLSMYAAVLADNEKGVESEKVLTDGLKIHSATKDENYLRLQRLLASTLGRNKKWKEAVAQYESIVSEAGEDSKLVNDSEFYFNFGAAAERAGNLELAAQNLQKALELVPKPDREFEPIRELMTQKIIIQSRLMSTTDPLDEETKVLAEEQLRQIDAQIVDVAQRLDRFRATILNYLGYMWVDSGQNLDVAGELIKKAIELDPESEHIVDSLGWYFFKKEQYVEAMNHLSRAEAMMEEENSEVLDHLAQTYHKIGNNEEAISYLQRAIKLDPDNKTELEARLKEYQGN